MHATALTSLSHKLNWFCGTVVVVCTLRTVHTDVTGYYFVLLFSECLLQDRYMALDFRGDCHLEMDALVSEAEGLGIDGVFVDCPISANRWKKGYLTARAAGRFTAAQGSKKTAFFTDDDDVEPEIRPVAAISTYAIVCVLIAACGVYAWIRRQQDVSLHGTYKVMTSPRVDDANADSQRNSQRGSQRDSQQGQTLDIE